jgi:hypothetical protein
VAKGAEHRQKFEQLRFVDTAIAEVVGNGPGDFVLMAQDRRLDPVEQGAAGGETGMDIESEGGSLAFEQVLQSAH